MERNKSKVAVIQKSKLSPKSKNPCIRNYTTVGKDSPPFHDIPTGRHRLHEELVPAEILYVKTRRDDLHKRDATSLELIMTSRTHLYIQKEKMERFC